MTIIRLWRYSIFACIAENTESTFHAVDLLLDMLFLAGGAGLRRILRYQGFKRFCSSNCACNYTRTRENVFRGENCQDIQFVLNV